MSRFRDWWRGYQDKDIETLRAKLEVPESMRVGVIIELSAQEYRAYVAGEVKYLRIDDLSDNLPHISPSI